MATLNYIDLILEELSVGDQPLSKDIVDTHWARFSSAPSEEARYLLAKRGTARSLLSKARKKVDTQIGFDQIKANQMVANLQKIIQDVSDELEESFPEISGNNELHSLSPEASLYGDTDGY